MQTARVTLEEEEEEEVEEGAKVMRSDHPGPIGREEEDEALMMMKMMSFIYSLQEVNVVRSDLYHLCVPKCNTRGGWNGHLGSGILETPCYKLGTSVKKESAKGSVQGRCDYYSLGY